MDYINLDLKENGNTFRRKDELFKYSSIFLSIIFFLLAILIIVNNVSINKKTKETLLIKAKKKNIILEENRKINKEKRLLNSEIEKILIDKKVEKRIDSINKKLRNISLSEKIFLIEKILEGSKSKLDLFNFDGKVIIVLINLDRDTNSKEMVKSFEKSFEKVIMKERDKDKMRLELRW